MKSKQIFALILALGTSLMIVGCGGGGGGSNPNGGFFLQADRHEISATTGSEIIVPTSMRVQGTFLDPQGTTSGTVTSFGPLDFTNFKDIANGKVPARWRFTYVEINQFGRIPCQDGIVTVDRDVHNSETEHLHCFARVFPITSSPNVIDVHSPPSNLVIGVQGVNAAFAPPQVAIYDGFGQLFAVVPATIVNNAKGRIQIQLPDISNVPSGIYPLTVSNILQDGTWDVIGGTELTIYGNDPPPPPGGGGDPCAIPAPCLF